VVPNERDLWTFVLAYVAFHIWWVTVTPLVFVLIKWIVIGRYRAGRYPIWGGYYLRWWFVDVMRQMFLRGIWGSNEFTLSLYYRMLGAKIGKNARISLEADIAEYDLVQIGENAAVEASTVRAFGVDNGAMILGPVSIGENGSVGVRSVVAPFTSVPNQCHLGPVTSSYDVKGFDGKHIHVNRRHMPEPSVWMQLVIAVPLHFLVNCVGQIPPLIVLWGMLQIKGEAGQFTTPSDLMEWLCMPQRIPYYIGIRLARALLTPFFYMGAAIFVKKFIIGEFQPGPKDLTSQWQLMRHHLAATLFSRKKIQNVVDIIGRHYELVSCLYRLLGAKVGKRVFWPGHQPIFSGEFDLLEIGDDVVFGSRSSIFNSTTTSCEKVILCAGANVADNCVVLPGSIVGKNAVLGSNSVCPTGWYLPEGSVWFGSKGSEPTYLEKGTENSGRVTASEVDVSTLPMVGDASTIRPFGRAFYMRQATYFVWPLSFIVSGTVAIKAFIATFHSLPLLAALQGTSALLYGYQMADRNYEIQYDSATIYFLVLFCFFWINIARVFIWLAIDLSAKWALIGHRKVGTYNYDTSDYAQRWEAYQLIGKIRKFSRFSFLQFFFGTPYMTLYFRLKGGQIGKDCCLYPSGADPFMPEPDLVVIGNRCVIDCASIVGHLNTVSCVFVQSSQYSK
jgi:acetyltransferase-like isoleucine patch superfamily enzyme